MTERVYCFDGYHQFRECCSSMTSRWLYSHNSTGGRWQNWGSVWIRMNLPVYTKPSGIQATTAWPRVLVKSKCSHQSHWTSKIRGLAKWCKHTWALMMVPPLPRKKGRYRQQLKGAQSWYGDGNEEGKESTGCKMSCCGSFTGTHNSLDEDPQKKYCSNDSWDTDTLKPCKKIHFYNISWVKMGPNCPCFSKKDQEPTFRKGKLPWFNNTPLQKQKCRKTYEKKA